MSWGLGERQWEEPNHVLWATSFLSGVCINKLKDPESPDPRTARPWCFYAERNGILDGCFLAFVYGWWWRRGGGEGRDNCFLIQMESGRAWWESLLSLIFWCELYPF